MSDNQTNPLRSVFADYEDEAYPYKYEVELLVDHIAGGTPSDPKVAEGWLRSKVDTTDDLIREQIAQVMAERQIPKDQAAEFVDLQKHLNGFRRDDQGLYIEGRQAKAMLKEASNVRWPKRRWGESKKGTRSYWAEHVFIPDEKIHLGVTEPSRIVQRFVHTWRGNGISYEEIVDEAKLSFRVITDAEFSEKDWALLWLTAEQEGIGAARSQGNGRFVVTRFDRV